MNLSPTLEFHVFGHPQPAGSKRAFPIRRKHGGIGVAVTESNPKAHDWKVDVAHAAHDAMASKNGDGELLDGPLALHVAFEVRRPKGHFGTGRNAGTLRAGAPTYPITKPDATKLLRALEDALTGVVWHDDAQVVEQSVSKHYGEPEGAHVAVHRC